MKDQWKEFVGALALGLVASASTVSSGCLHRPIENPNFSLSASRGI